MIQRDDPSSSPLRRLTLQPSNTMTNTTARPARTLRLSALALAVGFTCLAGLPAAGQKTAIKAGRILTQAPVEEGAEPEVIENGVILIQNGRITAVGADVEIPWDANVIDASGLTAFPGFVEAHTSRGMDRANENLDVAPFLSVRDSIDPVNFYFEDALRWGVTTINVQQGGECVIGAQGIVVKPNGLTVAEMMVKPDAGLKLVASPKRGLSRATQAQALRTAFGDLRRYLEEIVADKKQGGDMARREALFQGRDLEAPEGKKGRAMTGAAWTVAGLETIPRNEIDEKQEPLLRLVEGSIPAFFHCETALDVHRAIEIATDNGFLARTSLVLGPACWKAAKAVADADVTAILVGSLVHTERDPIDGTEIETFVPTKYRDAGARFVLSSDGSASATLGFLAAEAVGRGLTRSEALDAVTLDAAAALGLADRLGSLEKGKDGNVLLMSGDPLATTTWVEHVVLEGRHVYDRSKDHRMKHILEGQAPPGTAAMGAEAAPPPHEHDDESDDKSGEGEGDAGKGGDEGGK
jgi:imidazolonepropionase-like amidohydrolase